MCGMLESTAKKIKSVKPRGNVMVHVPDHDRAKIDAHSLHAVIVEEYSNGQFKLGTKYVHSNSCFEQNALSNNLDIKRN